MSTKNIKLKDLGDVAVIIFDNENEKVNTLSSFVLKEFKTLIEQVKNSSNFKALIIGSNKPKSFIVGADIKEIKTVNSKTDCLEMLNTAHDILNYLEDLKIPKIVAINGHCLGGGCELALACDYRVASDNSVLALPEVKLGIFPGFGGCIRLPKLVGLQGALSMILSGAMFNAKKALRLGLVDEVISLELLEDHCLSVAKKFINKKKIIRPKKRKTAFVKKLVNIFLESFLGRKIVYNKAKEGVLKQTKGFYPAPLAALNVIKKTYKKLSRKKALKLEAKFFSDVVVTDVSKHLINLFFLTEKLKKQTGVSSTEVKALKIKNMAVLGAGTMGGGIAHLAANKGIFVRIKDLNYKSLSLALNFAQSLWNKSLKRRKINIYQVKSNMDLLSTTLDYSGFKNTDLAIEAVVENMDIKKSVIKEMANNSKDSCIIATNTSSLSVTEMSEAHPRPENFIGMHFFNPVNKMPLVEVIRGKKTSDQTVVTTFELAKKMGKIPVVVKDGTGFLVNRLLLPWMAEALLLLEEGESVEKIDATFSKNFGMPMGPLRLIDEVGIDVSVKILNIFVNKFPDQIKVSSLCNTLVEKNILGKKDFKGFYLYDQKYKETGVNQNIYKTLSICQPTDQLKSNDILDRGFLTMINEASRALLEDKIVDTPEDIDIAMIMGTGFPPFKGGLLHYADSLGAKYIVNRLNEFTNSNGPRFKPSISLKAMLTEDGKFY